eukprot:TRINITY_DN2552_c0_g1_i1.p1 TRINITY_DN2552_c0_g1~~TRINITY_DN2552_c0_g1_i1.p1  ORF type:complete len:183 (+),score=19.16 TRINITY_DN2552_c0_g1_i1:425-973(+)
MRLEAACRHRQRVAAVVARLEARESALQLCIAEAGAGLAALQDQCDALRAEAATGARAQHEALQRKFAETTAELTVLEERCSALREEADAGELQRPVTTVQHATGLKSERGEVRWGAMQAQVPQWEGVTPLKTRKQGRQLRAPVGAWSTTDKGLLQYQVHRGSPLFLSTSPYNLNSCQPSVV